MLEAKAHPESREALAPETIFADETSFEDNRIKDEKCQENREKLRTLFRRYSRCDDILLTPKEHVAAIKQRFNTMMGRSMERPALFERLRKSAWGIIELDYQSKKGVPSEVKLGLSDNKIVLQTLEELREQVKAGIIRFPIPR